MSKQIKVRPVVPLVGGATGLALAKLRGKSTRETLLYGLAGAGLAWAGAATLIARVAGSQITPVTPAQAKQLAGFIQDRQQQRQSPFLTQDERQRIRREIVYLTNVLNQSNYQYKNGEALLKIKAT